MEQFLSVRLVYLQCFTKVFEVVVKSQPIVYRNSQVLIELFIISVNIGRYVSTESSRTFTGMQELMADFFLFKDFMTLQMTLLLIEICR